MPIQPYDRRDLDQLVQDIVSDFSERTQAEFALLHGPHGYVGQMLGLTVCSAFQPIVMAQDGHPIGHEALMRPLAGGNFAVPPGVAFALAQEEGRVVTLDRVCRTVHLLNYLAAAPADGFLFLNIHPRHLANVHSHGRVFERILKHRAFPACRVVLEIVEGESPEESHLAEAVANYRRRDFAIALDDFGRAHSNLDRLWRLEPDFVKLDGSLIQEATVNPKVRAMLPRLVDLIHEVRAKVVIERVETAEQARIAADAGADYLQGYHFARPGRLPLAETPDAGEAAPAIPPPFSSLPTEAAAP